MEQFPAAQLTGILLLGIGAQWLAWRLRLPAILVLLVLGGAVGPAMQAAGYDKLIDPDAVLGDLLVPIVSLSVAVILFEGGLTLDVSELLHAGGVIRNLLTVGAAITWFVGAVAARWILGFPWPLAVLLGTIVMVTGPTVIGPLLRHVKPVGQSGPIIKWEGIVIDPLGAMLAVLVYEALLRGSVEAATVVFVWGILGVVTVGGAIGAISGWLLGIALRRFLVPDFLQSAVTLTAVLTTFVASNLVFAESGLLAVTVMGVVAANQPHSTIRSVREFKETLSVLFISQLFILLASRITLAEIAAAGWRPILYTAVLIVVARPLSVLLSTWRSGLSWGERAFLAAMAPRGIVAASVASLFALWLAAAGDEGAEQLVPVTFTVIVITVAVYGLGAPWISRRLGLSSENPGFLIAGGNLVARNIAKALHDEGINVLIADSNFDVTREVRLAGLPVVYSSVLSEFVDQQIELTDIGRLLAVTSNEEANTLAVMKFSREFGRDQTFQLATDAHRQGRKQKVAPELHGRVLFGPAVTYGKLAGRFAAGDVLKRTTFTDEFSWKDFQSLYGESAVPMFLIDKNGTLKPIVSGGPGAVKSGDSLISLVTPIPQE